MNKLLIALGTVAFAASLQAASVVWGGAIAAPDYTTSGNSAEYPATAYLLYAATDLGTSTSFDTGTGLSNTGFSKVDQYSITASDATSNWAFSKTYDKPGSDVNGFYQVLVTNAAGDQAALYEFSISGTTAASSPSNMKLNGSWSTNDTLLSGGYTVTVGNVPEPTSGLLLLLGMAGLALKRKRA